MRQVAPGESGRKDIRDANAFNYVEKLRASDRKERIRVTENGREAHDIFLCARKKFPRPENIPSDRWSLMTLDAPREWNLMMPKRIPTM